MTGFRRPASADASAVCSSSPPLPRPLLPAPLWEARTKAKKQLKAGPSHTAGRPSNRSGLNPPEGLGERRSIPPPPREPEPNSARTAARCDPLLGRRPRVTNSVTLVRRLRLCGSAERGENAAERRLRLLRRRGEARRPPPRPLRERAPRPPKTGTSQGSAGRGRWALPPPAGRSAAKPPDRTSPPSRRTPGPHRADEGRGPHVGGAKSRLGGRQPPPHPQPPLLRGPGRGPGGSGVLTSHGQEEGRFVVQ